MLEYDCPMGQCFSSFLTVSQKSRGRGEKEIGRYGIDKILQIVTYRTYKYSWLREEKSTSVRPSNVYIFLVFSVLLAHPSETIRRRPEVNRQHALTQPFFVPVALVDNMRLYGIQSPDPVALTGFFGVIRPLGIKFYAAKGDMAIKLWFCK